MELVERIRLELLERADADRAAEQQAYMKSARPFRGVAVPEVRRLVRTELRVQGPCGDRSAWEAVIRELWRRWSSTAT